jgi:transcriptional regulator with XRE-family HTH domain
MLTTGVLKVWCARCLLRLVNTVRKIRQEAGLTQALLARVSGVSATSIGRYETGRVSPTLDVLERLATAVDLTIKVSIIRAGNASRRAEGASPLKPESTPVQVPATPKQRHDLWTM